MSLRVRLPLALSLALVAASAGAAAQELPPPPAPVAGDTTPRAPGGEAALPASSSEEGPPLAHEVGVELRAPAEVLLGQWFELVAEGPLTDGAVLGFSVRPPDVLARRSEARPTITGAELRLSLVAARAGTLTLDGLMIEDGERLLGVAPVTIEVRSELPATATPRVAAPLDPLTLPLPAVPTWLVLAVITTGLALIGLWVVRQGRVIPVVLRSEPPDQLAMAALERLRLDLPVTAEQVAVFVLHVSDVLRDYIEGRFLVHAPAQTTEEFLVEALREPELAGRKQTLERFLTLCDLVKYARHRPAPAEAVGLLDTASAFVEQTR